MTPKEYVLAAVRTESSPQNALGNLLGLTNDWGYKPETLQTFRLLHSAIGLCTEVGELQECLLLGKGDVNFKEEIGDMCWYLAIGLHTVNDWPSLVSCSIGDPDVIISDLIITVGNLQNLVKRSLFYGKELPITETKQLLILIWYFCVSLVGDINPIMEANIAKLKARYPEKFTEDCALNRNLDTELKELEANLSEKALTNP